MSKWIWKWLILIGMTSFSIATVMDQGFKLGIDLQGGSSFTVEIDQAEIRKSIQEEEPEISDTALENRVKADAAAAQENAVEVIRNRIDSIGIAEPNIYATTAGENYRIIVQLPGIGDDKREEARTSIESVAFLSFRLVHKDNEEWITELFQKGEVPRGFKISENGAAYVSDFKAVPKEQRTRAFYEAMKKFNYHPGTEFLLEKNEDNQGRVTYRPYYVEARHRLTGERVKDARVQQHHVTGKPAVGISFDSDGRRIFGNLTRDYAPRGPKNPNNDIGRQLAIVLDGTLYSAPTINEEIPSGNAEISGSFSMTEAYRLSNVLRAGSLKAPVKIVEVRSVSPSLGKDSVDSGLRAMIYGGIAVLLFMLVYYMLCGVIANIALILNILLLPFGMVIAAGFLGTLTNATATAGTAVSLPTLTLPGIAGIVLTIGMAVDANVLIFERIREEQNAGKHFGNAITAGYDKVFSTIVDANITTLLTAVILFWQGSGPIRGFAVTLTAGILVSVYTALVVTRMFFDMLGSKKDFRTLKMLTLVKDARINFLSKRLIAAVLSTVIIITTWVMFFQRGVDSNFGVDFTGGASVAFTFDEKVPVEGIRAALEEAGVTDPVIQYQKDLGNELAGGVTEVLEVKVAYEDTEAAKASIPAAFTDNYAFQKEDSVGPQVGAELRKKGIWAIVAALVGIVIYISIRFQFAFAMGAIAALAHDVLITVGIFCLLGNQLSLPIIAALLTIVGYSVNDTIVVFDRIREDVKLNKNRPYAETANLSINRTLSRTLLTSITTLLTVTMLLLFGGGAIHDFAIALFIGILVGTYSSIFVATPVMLLWHKEKKA